MGRLLTWTDAQTFLAVAEHRSFSAAAAELGVGQPTISRRIRDIEQKLGQQLFERGRHGAVATAAAGRLLPAALQMAKWATEFDHLAQGNEAVAEGTVCIAAPPGIAVEKLAPFAAQLKRSNPSIRLEITASVDYLDLTRGQADIAIRIQAPTEPGLVAVHQGSYQPAVFGAPSYVEQLPAPVEWRELDWVTWSEQYRDVAPRPMLEKLIPGFVPIFTSDDFLVLRAAVAAGVGAFITGRAIGEPYPDLVEIDLGVELPGSTFYVVCAKSMQHVPRVRVVIERLAALLDD